MRRRGARGRNIGQADFRVIDPSAAFSVIPVEVIDPGKVQNINPPEVIGSPEEIIEQAPPVIITDDIEDADGMPWHEIEQAPSGPNGPPALPGTKMPTWAWGALIILGILAWRNSR